MVSASIGLFHTLVTTRNTENISDYLLTGKHGLCLHKKKILTKSVITTVFDSVKPSGNGILLKSFSIRHSLPVTSAYQDLKLYTEEGKKKSNQKQTNKQKTDMIMQQGKFTLLY